jgi:hypothetical protein
VAGPKKADPGAQLIPAPALASEFGVDRRTIGRWLVTPSMAFPRPLTINHRLYFVRKAVDEWRDAQMRKALGIP